MIVIKNATIIDPLSRTERLGDLAIKDGRIVTIGTIDVIENAQIIDATGLCLAPGLIDIHVHFREPGFEYKEDISTGAKAAAKGGFTTVVCMANTKPILDNQDTLDFFLEKAKKCSINVFTCAAITKGFNGTDLVDMEKLKSIGAVGFTDDGLPLTNSAVAFSAMKMAKKIGVPLSMHEEDPSLIGFAGINEGSVSAELGLKGADRLAEECMVARDIVLAAQTGAKVNVQHISSARTVDLIKFGKQIGAHVFAEVTPQHFAATEELIKVAGTNAKVNPPIRTEADRLALIKGLKDGVIDFIVTDHAPHSKDEKNRDFKDAPSGMIGLETALALTITYLVKPGHLTLIEALEKMTVNPAKLYDLDCGYIEKGAVADLVLFDPNEEYIIEDDFASKSSNSPFIGQKVLGKVKYTIAKGKIVYKD